MIGEFRKQTVPVDAFRPNAWSIYQVHGNAYDWIEDCYHYSYTGAPSDGSAWISGDCTYRALRGGSWFNDPTDLRAANIGGNAPAIQDSDHGFRVARAL
jgi:formylglycine-generating enzyme required for sulfatase activity